LLLTVEERNERMIDDPKEQWRAVVSRPLQATQFAPESSAIALEIGAASVCGKSNSHNTDHYLAIRLGRLQETVTASLAASDLPSRFEEYSYAMLVADGLGTDVGARASRVALSALAHLAIQYGRWNVRVNPETAKEIAAQVEFFGGAVHDAVRDASRSDFRLADMATSLTALYVAEDNLFFAHVGHSTAFLLRDGILIQLTTSHTLQQRRRAVDRVTPLDQTKLDSGHRVTEMIGGRPAAPDVENEHIKLLTGDRLLLCTNGLTDVLTQDRIADVLAPRRDPKEDCRRLIDLAVAQGSSDDVTVVLADYTLRSDRANAQLPAIA
jgi:serine/threonine protein phosphatase PrpC